MSTVRKLLVAVAGVLAALGTSLADGSIDAQEAGVIAGAVAVAVGVYFAKNEASA